MLLLLELIEIVLASISNSIDFKNIYCWSDSLDSLFWIKGENKTWKPFIENRVIKIRKIVHPSKWRFCPGNKTQPIYHHVGYAPQNFIVIFSVTGLRDQLLFAKMKVVGQLILVTLIYLKMSKSLM